MMTEAQYVYPIKGSLGSCIIFNMEYFKNNPAKRRHGTQVDSAVIKEAFTKFGYDVYTVENPTNNKVEEKMTESIFIIFVTFLYWCSL